MSSIRTSVGLAFALLSACTPQGPPADAPPVAARETVPLHGLLPAGTCGYAPYLDNACASDDPDFAVTTWRGSDVRSAEAALRHGPRVGGYPFAVSFDDLPPADARVRGIAVVAGLFVTREDAAAYRRALGRGQVVPLASGAEYRHRIHGNHRYASFDEQQKAIHHVVQIATDTLAYDAKDLERIERAFDEGPWVPFRAQQTRRAAALARLRPRCRLRAGRVFVTNGVVLYNFMRSYAPVTCDDGREAWVPWRATRLESTVVREHGAFEVHQVIDVECDVPRLETRAFGRVLPTVSRPHCRDLRRLTSPVVRRLAVVGRNALAHPSCSAAQRRAILEGKRARAGRHPSSTAKRRLFDGPCRVQLEGPLVGSGPLERRQVLLQDHGTQAGPNTEPLVLLHPAQDLTLGDSKHDKTDRRAHFGAHAPVAIAEKRVAERVIEHHVTPAPRLLADRFAGAERRILPRGRRQALPRFEPPRSEQVVQGDARHAARLERAGQGGLPGERGTAEQEEAQPEVSVHRPRKRFMDGRVKHGRTPRAKPFCGRSGRMRLASTAAPRDCIELQTSRRSSLGSGGSSVPNDEKAAGSTGHRNIALRVSGEF